MRRKNVATEQQHLEASRQFQEYYDASRICRPPYRVWTDRKSRTFEDSKFGIESRSGEEAFAPEETSIDVAS
jgi:hypothetical protein